MTVNASQINRMFERCPGCGKARAHFGSIAVWAAGSAPRKVYTYALCVLCTRDLKRGTPAEQQALYKRIERRLVAGSEEVARWRPSK